MSAELIVLSVGAAAAALIFTRVLSLRADARGVARSTGRARDVLGRGGTAAHGSGPAEGGPTSERASQEIPTFPRCGVERPMIHGRCKTRLAGESRTCSSRCWRS